MTEESNDLQSNTSDLDHMLRLVRLQKRTDLSEATLQDIRNQLSGKHEVVEPTIKSLPVQETQAVNPGSTDVDLRIRQLMQAGAPWQSIVDLLWSDYKREPTDQHAARLLEISFVQTSPGETMASLTQLMDRGQKGFYWLLHHRLRDFILEHAEASIVDSLYWMIAKERNPSKLTDVEVLFIFLKLTSGKDQTAPWIYFMRNQERILGCCNNSARLGCTKDQVLLKAGELALSLGYTEEARELFAKIPRLSRDRDTALQILLKYESATLNRKKSPCFIALEATPQWTDRIRLVDSFCQEIRCNGGLKDPNRSALNIILKNPLEWVPKTAEAWRAVSELIVRNRDLCEILPAMLQVFHDHACKHYPSELDLALWAAPIHLQPESATDGFLSGLGWLHFFIASEHRTDSALWSARRMILWATANSATTLVWNWREVVRAAIAYVERGNHFLEQDRKRMVSALRMSVDGASSPDETIEAYLSLSDAPAPEVLDDLAEQTWAKKSYASFVQLAATRANLSIYENRTLTRLWTAAAMIQNPDLAWRAASLLAARDSLSPKIRHSWEISGEKRSVYAATNLTTAQLDVALDGLPRNSRRILGALHTLGSRIVELAEFTKKSSLTERAAMRPCSSTEEALTKAITQAGFPPLGKTILEAASFHDLPQDIAALHQSPDSNPWLFAVRTIFERMGAPVWGYQRKALHDLASSVLPLIGTGSSSHGPAKMGKWLMSLSTHQRAAWSELSAALVDEADQNFTQSLVVFVTRAATMFYPSHYEALKSLHKARVTLTTVRSLENFILSPAYSGFRQRAHLQSRVIVPKMIAEQDISGCGK